MTSEDIKHQLIRGIGYWLSSILRLNKQHVQILRSNRCQIILHMALVHKKEVGKQQQAIKIIMKEDN